MHDSFNQLSIIIEHIIPANDAESKCIVIEMVSAAFGIACGVHGCQLLRLECRCYYARTKVSMQRLYVCVWENTKHFRVFDSRRIALFVVNQCVVFYLNRIFRE